MCDAWRFATMCMGRCRPRRLAGWTRFWRVRRCRRGRTGGGCTHGNRDGRMRCRRKLRRGFGRRVARGKRRIPGARVSSVAARSWLRCRRRFGAAGHGRTQRPELAKKTEARDPPQTDRVCGTCGASYVANGSHVLEIVEVEVRAHRRVLRRRACDCASSPREVSAPPVARLFANTPYGVSFWARFLYECYACFRPVNRIAAWMSEQGLRLSAGTLSSSILRFLPLFAPLSEAILARQNGCARAARPAGGSRRSARRAPRAAPGCGWGFRSTRCGFMSIARAAPRQQPPERPQQPAAALQPPESAETTGKHPEA